MTKTNYPGTVTAFAVKNAMDVFYQKIPGMTKALTQTIEKNSGISADTLSDLVGEVTEEFHSKIYDELNKHELLL
jgi:hypothetical protein